MRSKVAGVGFNSRGRFVAAEHKLAGAKWRDMLHRCYDADQYGFAQYGAAGVSVCEQWHDFQVFAVWIAAQRNYGRTGYELDKDILIPNNKVYRPEACCLVPRVINSAVLGQVRGSLLKTGVSTTNNPKRPYRARLSVDGKVVNIGVYETELEAHLAYNARKREYVWSLAERFRDDVDDKVYVSLSVWEPSYE